MFLITYFANQIVDRVDYNGIMKDVLVLQVFQVAD